jgi:hypothetical protein
MAAPQSRIRARAKTIGDRYMLLFPLVTKRATWTDWSARLSIVSMIASVSRSIPLAPAGRGGWQPLPGGLCWAPYQKHRSRDARRLAFYAQNGVILTGVLLIFFLIGTATAWRVVRRLNSDLYWALFACILVVELVWRLRVTFFQEWTTCMHFRSLR